MKTMGGPKHVARQGFMAKESRQPSRSNLRPWLISFGVGSILLVNGILAMDLVRQHGETMNNAADSQATLATGLEQYTARTLETVDASLQGLAEQIMERHGPISLDHPEISELLENTFTGPNVANYIVVNAQGRYVNDAAGLADPEVQLGDRPYVRLHRLLPDTGLYLEEPLQPRASNGDSEQRFVAASRGLRNSDGEFLGVVAAVIDPDYYSGLYEQLSGPESTLGLLDERGDVVTAHGEELDWLLDTDGLADLSEGRRLEHPESGDEYMTVSRQVQAYPLMTVVATPMDAVLSEWRGEAMRSGALGGGISLALGLATLFMLRQNNRGLETERRLRESEERFRGLIESTSDFVWEMNENGYCVYASPQVRDIMGYDPEEVIGMRPYDPMTTDEQDRITDVYHELISARKPFHMLENRNLHRDGREVVLETSGVPIFDENNVFRGYRGIDRDITERKRLEEALHALALLSGQETETEFFQLIAHHLSRALGMRHAFVIETPEGRPARTRAYHDELDPRGHTPPQPDTVIGGLGLQGRRIIREKACEALSESAMLAELEAVSLMATPIHRTSGEHWGLLLAVDAEPLSPARVSRLEPVLEIFTSRISLELDRNEVEAALSWEASHDTLTGLWNRRAFETELESILENPPTQGRNHSLLYIDLDQFKLINDTCGHAAGDQMLIQLSKRMQERVRASDQLARLGGDEFGMILQDCPAHRCEEIAQALLDTIRGFQFDWEGQSYTVGASIGIAHATDGRTDSKDLLAQADLACYAAKDLGRNRIQTYQAENDHIRSRHGEMGWIPRLERALEENRLEIHGQWVVPLLEGDRRRPSIEALVRMRDTDGSCIPPGEFIPAAERYNLMDRVDRYVIDAVMHHAASAEGPTPRRWSINISGRSLGDGTLANFIEERFEHYGLDPRRFCFELTETAAMTNFQHARELFIRLRALGSRTALDDFGSGLSSFGYLRQLQVDVLKIDGSFVREAHRDSVSRSMVQAMNEMGRAMGLDTVAEFVEDDEIRQVVADLGVVLAQGYGIHRPEPVGEMGEPPERRD